MAGILDYFGLGGTPDGGILSGDAWQPPKTAAAPATVSPWADRLGLFGAALQDAGANFSGHPESATRLSGYNKAMLQQKLQQALAGATSTDPAVRAQAYALARANGIDTAPFEKAAAAGAMPDLLKQMQPQLNPVQSTPAVTPDNPVGSPMRQAAMTAPLESQPTLSDALSHVNSPELQAQMAPEIIKDQLARQDKAMTTLPPDQVAQLGFRPGTIVQKDAYGNLKVAQASDVKSKEAVQQTLQEKIDEAKNVPVTQQQAIQNRIAAQNAAREAAAQGEAARHNRAMEGPELSAAGGVALPDLKSYPVGVQSTVKAMLDGRQAPPSSMALSKPYWQNLIALANAQDPNFDQTNWGARAAARKDFTGGGTSYKTLNSGNTAIQHLGRLADQIPTVAGHQIPLIGNYVNSAENALALKSGTGQSNTYNDTLGHLAEETTKFYRGTGGNEADVSRNMANLGADLSQQQKRGGVENTVHLIFGKLAPMVEQYNKTMGTNFPASHFLSSEAVKTMKKMGYDPDSGEKTAKPQAAPNPASLPRKATAGKTVRFEDLP